jgi:glycosyltransferase involved in cell wall biosynthesis
MPAMNNLPHAPSGARISCLICAWNEAPRLGGVLAVVERHPLIGEVIVVDDGSTDGTADVAHAFPSVRTITCASNRGKSAAMATGVAAARHDLLMLLDADLKGLTADDVSALAWPVLDGVADVSLSLRRNSLALFRLLGLDFVSGERVLRRALLAEALAEMHALPRFGVEVYMNHRIIDERLPIAVVRWPRVTQARKTEKLGWRRGLRAEARMIGDLLRAAYPLELVSQTWRLLGLRASAVATAGSGRRPDPGIQMRGSGPRA